MTVVRAAGGSRDHAKTGLDEEHDEGRGMTETLTAGTRDIRSSGPTRSTGVVSGVRKETIVNSGEAVRG
jgi:hypothetical protein